MRSLLTGAGHQLVESPSDAELLVVNTCGFIEAAKQESIDTLLELGAAKRSDQRLIATGCLVERYAEDLASEIGEIDGLLGARNWATLPSLVSRLETAEPGSSLQLVDLAPAGRLDLAMPRRVAAGPSAPTPFDNGTDVVRHARAMTSRPAVVSAPRALFAAIPGRIGRPRESGPRAIVRGW